MKKVNEYTVYLKHISYDQTCKSVLDYWSHCKSLIVNLFFYYWWTLPLVDGFLTELFLKLVERLCLL